MFEKVAETAPIQANCVLATIRKIFNWAISQDIVEANHQHRHPLPVLDEQRRVFREELDSWGAEFLREFEGTLQQAAPIALPSDVEGPRSDRGRF